MTNLQFLLIHCALALVTGVGTAFAMHWFAWYGPKRAAGFGCIGTMFLSVALFVGVCLYIGYSVSCETIAGYEWCVTDFHASSMTLALIVWWAATCAPYAILYEQARQREIDEIFARIPRRQITTRAGS